MAVTPDTVRFWPGTRPLMTQQATPKTDLTAAVGQRQCTFRFDLTDGVTGETLGAVTPIRTPATLTHDTSRTTKRNLSIALGKADTAAINPVRDRISPYLVFPGTAEYPLGRYMFTAPQTALVATQQRLGTFELND